jgi:hypothetical protein
MVRETHEQRYERAGCLPALLFLRDELLRILYRRTSENSSSTQSEAYAYPCWSRLPNQSLSGAEVNHFETRIALLESGAAYE